MLLRPMSAKDRHPRSQDDGRPPEVSFAPLKLSWILFLLLAYIGICSAQTSSQSLTISTFPSLKNLPPLNSSHPVIQISFPTTSSLYLTLNLCSLSSNTSLVPAVFVSEGTNGFQLGTRIIRDSASGGTSDGGYNMKARNSNVWSITWDKGFGNWTGTNLGSNSISVLIGLDLNSDGSSRSISTSGNVIMQLGVSSSNPLHTLSGTSPFLGDTTSTTALILSPVVIPSPQTQPTYPNYTLPPAQLSFSVPPSTQYPDLSLILVPTGSSPTNDNLGNSLCAVRTANTSTGGLANPRNLVLNRTDPIWTRMDGVEGYRFAWGVGGLTSAGGNYTAWVLNESSKELSYPIQMVTKDSDFLCPLLLPTSFCPSISYATPLQSSGNTVLCTIPDEITSIITSNLQSFSTSLLSQACGRDMFSYTSSCLDCYTSYRDWLCRMLLPRCTSPSSPSTSSPSYSYANFSSYFNSRGVPLPQTTQRTSSSPRIPGVPLVIPDGGYNELLPCLSTCYEVDRRCPTMMNFRCPLRHHGANMSYAFIGDEDTVGDGSADQGYKNHDQYGNVWCNG